MSDQTTAVQRVCRDEARLKKEECKPLESNGASQPPLSRGDEPVTGGNSSCVLLERLPSKSSVKKSARDSAGVTSSLSRTTFKSVSGDRGKEVSWSHAWTTRVTDL
jgi:hypothetical protein